MTTTITVNCGCGFRVSDSATLLKPGTQANIQPLKVMVEAQEHCEATGHTMEILGTVQP